MTVYFIGIIVGLVLPQVKPNTKIQEPLKLGLPFILKNNLRSIILLLSGAFLFGSSTAFNLVFNGMFLTLIAEAFLSGLTFNDIFLFTAPHAIFEIPAIIIAGAAGFKIPYEIVRYLAGKKDQPLTKEDIKEYLTLALISIILIVIAAWIEANVTLQIAKAMLSTKGI